MGRQFYKEKSRQGRFVKGVSWGEILDQRTLKKKLEPGPQKNEDRPSADVGFFWGTTPSKERALEEKLKPKNIFGCKTAEKPKEFGVK